MTARLVVGGHDVAPAAATPVQVWLDALDRRRLRTGGALLAEAAAR